MILEYPAIAFVIHVHAPREILHSDLNDSL